MDAAELDLIIIFIFALIYSSVSIFFISKLDFYRKYQDNMKRYWEEYTKFLKEGLSLSLEEIEARKKVLNSILIDQLKNMLKVSAIYAVLFLGIVALIQFFIVELPSDHPYGTICIVDNKYIYENGVYKVPDILDDRTIDSGEFRTYVCPRAILYLPFPILNLRYIIGEIKIFIFFVIIISMILGMVSKRFLR